jgi:hypothetical protein
VPNDGAVADKVIDVPGLGTVSFPGSMADEDISTAIARSMPLSAKPIPQQPGPMAARQQFLRGVAPNLTEEGIKNANAGTLPTVGAIVGGAAGGPFAPETGALGAGAGTFVEQALQGRPPDAWEAAKNAITTEVGGRVLSLASRYGAPLLNKIGDLLDEFELKDYDLKIPNKPLKMSDWISKKPAGMSGSPSAEDLAKAKFQNTGYKPSVGQAMNPKQPPPSMMSGTSTAPGTMSDLAMSQQLPPVPSNPAQPPAAIIPKAAQEPILKGRTVFVPMKSTPLPESAKPGDLWTIPREKLVDLAKSGNADAATVLQRLGHKVIFVPNVE